MDCEFTNQDLTLRCLASVNEFTALLDGTNLRDADKQLVKSYNAFLQATDDNKATMLSSMFGRAHISWQLIALRYLLQNNKTDLLTQLGIVTGDNATVSMRTKPYEAIAHILGYQVSGNINALVSGTRALQ